MPAAAVRRCSSTRVSRSKAIYSCVSKAPAFRPGLFYVAPGLETTGGPYQCCIIERNVPRPCEEKDQLRKLYNAALDELVEATTALRRAQYGPEFLDALHKTQKVRTAYENVRRALEDHRGAHGC